MILLCNGCKTEKDAMMRVVEEHDEIMRAVAISSVNIQFKASSISVDANSVSCSSHGACRFGRGIRFPDLSLIGKVNRASVGPCKRIPCQMNSNPSYNLDA